MSRLDLSRVRRPRRPILIDSDAGSLIKGAIPALIVLGVLITSCVQTGFDFKYFALGLLSAAGLFLLSLTRTKWHVIRWIYTAVFVIGMPVASTFLLQSFTISPIGEKGIYLKMLFVNFAIMFLLFMFLVGLLGSLKNGYSAALVLVALIGIINYFVVLFRGSPVMPWDVLSIRTALSVSSGYDYDLNRRFFWCLTGFIGMFVLSRKMEGYVWSWLLRILIVVLTAAAAVFGTMKLNQKETKDYLGMDQTLFTPNVCYRNNGLAATFVGNLGLLRISRPSGYSGAEVEEIAERAKASVSDKSVSAPMNVVVIMDEAFSDLSYLGDFETSEDYAPTVRRLQAECGGWLTVSVKGGNTANTEFEFLTGDTMAFLPTGAIPYQQYVKGFLPSVASQMRYLGYGTTAIHPYRPQGWNRDEVYPLLGFDRFLSQNDFENPETLRGYVTDAEMFGRIADEIRENDEPQFIFGVTMQNHGGYSHEYEDLSAEVKLPALDDSSKQVEAAEKYLTLVKKTDEALAGLEEELKGIGEPTVVLFFGDHQPSDYITHVIDGLVGRDGDSSDPEIEGASYVVPYLVWNNYGAEYDFPVSTSVGFLSARFFREIGIPLTSYQKFLIKASETIPAINASSAEGIDGRKKSLADLTESEKTVADEYRIMQYNHLFDKNRKEEVFSYGTR